MTTHTVTFAFDRAFLWRALWRDHAWRALYASVVFSAVALLLAWPLGVRGWWYWAPLGLLFLLLLSAIRLRIAVGRTEDLWRKQSPSGTIRYLFDAESFMVVMEHAQSRYAWTDLRRLWRYPDVWLFEIVRMQSVLFPPQCASEDAKVFLVSCCRNAGVRV